MDIPKQDEKTKMLEARLQRYRYVAALMLADWWAIRDPAKFRDKHKRLLSSLVRGDFATVLRDPDSRRKRHKAEN